MTEVDGLATNMGNNMKGELEQQSLLLRLEERLAMSRKQLDLIGGLMRQEREKRYSDRQHHLMIFLAAERRVYSAVIAELEQIRSLPTETCRNDESLMPPKTGMPNVG